MSDMEVAMTVKATELGRPVEETELSLDELHAVLANYADLSSSWRAFGVDAGATPSKASIMALRDRGVALVRLQHLLVRCYRWLCAERHLARATVSPGDLDFTALDETELGQCKLRDVAAACRGFLGQFGVSAAIAAGIKEGEHCSSQGL